MSPHYCTISIFTPVHSVILGISWRSLWPQGWTTPTPLCMECQHLTCTIYSLPKILSLMWLCLLFVIFQQMSDLVTSTVFLFTTEYSSKLRHLPIRPFQPVSHLIYIQSPPSTPAITGCSFFNPQTSRYHTCPPISVGVPSATALLQHVIRFLLPLKIYSLYSFKCHLKSHLIAQLINN